MNLQPTYERLSQNAVKVHPCLSCGACCSVFRVSFHWSETFKESHGVPEELSTQISPYVNAMNGTNQKDPKCEALRGQVGGRVLCAIYENRPNCCRTFKASYENNIHNLRCDDARKIKGIPPLTSADW